MCAARATTPLKRIADLRRCLPEATDLARIVASPRWRGLATGDTGQQRQFITGIGTAARTARMPAARPGEAIAHWIEYGSWRVRRAAAAPYQHAKLARQERSALWLDLNRDGGNVILHHRNSGLC